MFRKQEYGLTLLVSTEAEVNKYLDSILAQIKDWLEQRKVGNDRVAIYVFFLRCISGVYKVPINLISFPHPPIFQLDFLPLTSLQRGVRGLPLEIFLKMGY